MNTVKGWKNMKRAESVMWNIELMVNCPHCDDYIDVEEDLLADYEVCEPVKNVERKCPTCKKYFVFDVEGGR